MSVNELGSSRPFFTKDIRRDVYEAIDPTKASLSLPGKTILVTGAGRGIGIAIAESFAKAQAKTRLVLLKAKTEFESKYPKVQFIIATVDIGKPESVDSLFATLKGKVEVIDILVNNAAVSSDTFGAKIGETNVGIFFEETAINTSGPYLLARGLIHFNPPNYSTTFITLTTGVVEPFTGMMSYILSKLPPVKFIEMLDAEYPNFRTFAVIPGIIPTDMLQPGPMTELFSPLALDKPALAGGVLVWLSHPHADFLSGRFLDARWDVEQVVERKKEIVENDWLKLRIGGY